MDSSRASALDDNHLELLNEIEAQAAKLGMKVETLVQWLQQKLDEEVA